MGFTSQDDMIAQITAGKYLRREMSKLMNPAHTAGGWHLLAPMGGYPNASTFPGTDLVWSNCDEFTGDGTTILGLNAGGPPGGAATKHLINLGAMVVAAAGAPWQVKLVDLQGYYRLSTTNVTGVSTRTLINANTVVASSSSGLLLTFANDWKSGTKVRFTTTTTLPTGLSLATDYWLVRVSSTTARVATSYANYVAGTVVAFTDVGTGTHTMTIQMPRAAFGVGCEATFVVQTQPTAGGPNLTASDYFATSSPTSGSRSFQGSVNMGATADAYASRVLHSGNAAGRYGPFLPRQGGDTGIAVINSFNWTTGTAYTGTGVVALCVVKPLCDLPLPVTGAWAERDLVNQLMSMPQIQDGACIVPMIFATGATTANSPLNMALDFAWGG